MALEEAKRRIFETHGNKIELLEYTAAEKVALFHCNICDHKWSEVASYVWKGNECPMCKPRKPFSQRRYSIDYIRNFIESENCELISNKYINSKTKLDVKFECGHYGKISFDCFRKGVRCPLCISERISLGVRIPIEEVIVRLKQKNLIIVEFPDGYKTGKSLVTCLCDKGHLTTKRLDYFYTTDGCNDCSLKELSTRQKGEKGSNWQGGKNSLSCFLLKSIKQWKKDSIANSNYCCELCGDGHRFNDVHHLYNFYNIVTDALNILNLDRRKTVGDYKEEELSIIADKVVELHYSHLYGVPLCRYHHKNFHHYYGISNNTPEQFYEYRERIISGDLVLLELN